MMSDKTTMKKVIIYLAEKKREKSWSDMPCPTILYEWFENKIKELIEN